MNAAFGISNQISSQAQSVSNVFLNASNPQIIKNFSSGEKEKAFKLANFISRFSFYVLFSFCLPIILNIDFVLQFWLKNVPDFAGIFFQLMIINFLIGVLCNPIITLIQATGKIRNFQIINSFVFLLNIPVAYFLLKFQFPPYTIVYSLMGSTFLGNVVKLYFIRKLGDFSIKKWVNEVLFNVILVSIIIVSFSLIFILFFPKALDFINFLFSSSLIFLIEIIIIMVFGFKKNEKMIVIDFLKKKCRIK
jgi:O-antigen/teichoic acid export membrane protein